MTPEEYREALARTIAEVTDQWDEPLDEVRDIPQIVNALLASGLIPEASHSVTEWRINYGDDEPTKPRPEHWCRTHYSERHGDVVETRTRTTFPDHYTEWKKADQ